MLSSSSNLGPPSFGLHRIATGNMRPKRVQKYYGQAYGKSERNNEVQFVVSTPCCFHSHHVCKESPWTPPKTFILVNLTISYHPSTLPTLHTHFPYTTYPSYPFPIHHVSSMPIFKPTPLFKSSHIPIKLISPISLSLIFHTFPYIFPFSFLS